MTDVPEADHQEQLQPVGSPEAPEPLPSDPEVPEADAIEQTLPAPIEDDDDRR